MLLTDRDTVVFPHRWLVAVLVVDTSIASNRSCHVMTASCNADRLVRVVFCVYGCRLMAGSLLLLSVLPVLR